MNINFSTIVSVYMHLCAYSDSCKAVKFPSNSYFLFPITVMLLKFLMFVKPVAFVATHKMTLTTQEHSTVVGGRAQYFAVTEHKTYRLRVAKP